MKNKVWYLLFAVLTACSPKVKIPKAPPNIVWITSEDNSTHYLKHFDPNGVATPNIEALAAHGITYRNAYANAPVCSVARSTIISGCYAPRVGVQFHRKLDKVDLPPGVEMYPAYLRKAGYYTTNKHKEDYNFNKADNVWDESSKKASWKNRKKGQPFFHITNFTTSHESRLHFTQTTMDTTKTKTPLDAFDIHPYHPQTELFRYTNAYYRDKIVQMDKQLGAVVAELKKDGLMDNTFIFYYGDHGGVLPGSKGYAYEVGLHVPMVVYIPKNYRHLVDAEINSNETGFVSFIDLAPTVLSLAGLPVPSGMDGKAFLGPTIKKAEVETRDEVFTHADRFDEKYDFVRALRKGKYKYIRNYQPFNFDGLMNNYRYRQLAFQEWWTLYEADKLNKDQSRFFETRAPEMLFDLEQDPYELNNLAGTAAHKEVLLDMRSRLQAKVKSLPDLSFFPEPYLVREAWSSPVSFGQKSAADIASYVDIADLSLKTLPAARLDLYRYLKDEDPWKRYWALIACATFEKDAFGFVDIAMEIAESDPELLNRTRAAEYLGLVEAGNPVEAMTQALYACTDSNEALLIMNSIVLLQDGLHKYKFTLDANKIHKSVFDNSEAARRLLYLGLVSS